MDEMIDQIVPTVSAALLGVLAVFVVFGMLFGLGRGLKRSLLRLVIFGGLLVAVFFLTPVIIKSGLGVNISINGMTPTEWVDELSDNLVELMQDQFGNYVTPFEAYIKDYAVGIVMAVLNLVVFLGLYFVVKVVSWFVYAIMARIVAPKRNRDGKRNPKHAWLGLLVGAVQGVVLFVFFMIPVNGVLGVVNQAAVYQATVESTTQPASTAAASDETDMGTILTKVDNGLAGYNTVMRYTGLQFLSNKAFEYQLTVRVNNQDNINLVHDINAGLELYLDVATLNQIMEKFEKAFNNGIDLAQITADDYKFLRKFVNKAFDLEILNIADNLIADLDQILNTPLSGDETYLDGTAIYADSFYGMIIKANTTERAIATTVADGETAPTNYAQYAAGLQAIVQDIADQKLDLVRHDVLNILNFMEVVGTYRVTYDGIDTPTTVTDVLALDGSTVQNSLDLATAKLAGKQGDFADGTPFIKVLGQTLGQFSMVRMLGLPQVDNLIIYGKMFEKQSDTDLQTFLYDFVPLFLGDSAFNHTDDQGLAVAGNWEKLGDLLYEVAGVFRDYCTIGDDINDIKTRLMNADPDLTADNAQIQAVIEYLGNLVLSKEDFDARADAFGEQTYDQVKYQKVDQLVDAVYDVVHTFTPVKTLLIAKLRVMQDSNEYAKTLITMLESDKDNWYSTVRGLVNAAHVLNNSVLGDLVDVLQNSAQLSGEELAAKVLDTVTNLQPENVSEVIYSMITIPEVGDTVKSALTETVNQINNSDIDYEAIFGAEEGESVKAQVEELNDYLQNFDNDSTETELQGIVDNLWQTVQRNQNLDNFLGQLGRVASN
ncbi:MAG: hypothetical protein NC133_01330 [Prevotella sp.]|nr:hypothetical protein [Prevotella sp.]